MILIIDNYDSFTYNLYQLVGKYATNIKVVKNDDEIIKTINLSNSDKIIFSPGPGRPDKAGMMKDIIRRYIKYVPMLGICLGHQAIAEVFNGTIINAPEICHGKVRSIEHNGACDIFKGVPKVFKSTRYHSLIINADSLSKDLRVTAATVRDNIVMGIEHKKYKIYGLQFHPESISSEYGDEIIKNFLNVA